MRFTESVKFLTELKDQVSNLAAVNQRLLEDGLEPEESPLEVLVVSAEYQDEADVTGESILTRWELLSVNDRVMEIQLTFTDPISVSAGDYEDIVFVQINFNKLPSVKDSSLPESVLKQRAIPP